MSAGLESHHALNWKNLATNESGLGWNTVVKNPGCFILQKQSYRLSRSWGPLLILLRSIFSNLLLRERRAVCLISWHWGIAYSLCGKYGIVEWYKWKLKVLFPVLAGPLTGCDRWADTNSSPLAVKGTRVIDVTEASQEINSKKRDPLETSKKTDVVWKANDKKTGWHSLCKSAEYSVDCLRKDRASVATTGLTVRDLSVVSSLNVVSIILFTYSQDLLKLKSIEEHSSVTRERISPNLKQLQRCETDRTASILIMLPNRYVRGIQGPISRVSQ